MRIVYYVVGWPPDRFANGIVTASDRISAALRRAGHEAYILAMNGAPRPGENHVLIINAARSGARLADYAERLRRRVSRFGATLDGPPRKIASAVHRCEALRAADIMEMEESFGWSRIVARRLAQPVVTRLHGPYFLTGGAASGGDFSPLEGERIRREGAAIKSAEFVTAPSRFVLGAVREKYRRALEQAVIIPNPAQTVDAGLRWRRERANPDEILFVGRFDRIKGADILLSAFARLAADYPKLRLTFAGPADNPIRVDGRSLGREAFLREIMPPEAAGRVDFLGLVSRNELSTLRARACLTVVASRIETFANVLLEAMAHASPVVATKVGGMPEMARAGEEALLAEPDAGALAAAIKSLLDHPDRAASIAESGHQRVISEFAPERVADLTLAAYTEVLARRRRSGAARKAGAR